MNVTISKFINIINELRFNSVVFSSNEQNDIEHSILNPLRYNIKFKTLRAFADPPVICMENDYGCVYFENIRSIDINEGTIKDTYELSLICAKYNSSIEYNLLLI